MWKENKQLNLLTLKGLFKYKEFYCSRVNQSNYIFPDILLNGKIGEYVINSDG